MDNCSLMKQTEIAAVAQDAPSPNDRRGRIAIRPNRGLVNGQTHRSAPTGGFLFNQD